MAKGSFRFPLYTGGSDPDPAVYCPANGYPDPDDLNNYTPTLGNWILLATFKTNSPGSTTFDPVIVSASPDSDFAWKIDDSVYNLKSLSVTLDGTEKTVYLYAKSTAAPITQLYSFSDHLVGRVDISKFGNVNVISLYDNPDITGVVFPEANTGTLSYLYIYSTGIKETVDISMFNTFNPTTGTQIHLYSNPALKGVNFPSSYTGKLLNLYLYSTGFVGIMDLQWMDKLTDSCLISIGQNPNMTGVKFAASITGKVRILNMGSSGIMGAVDISMFTSWGTNAVLSINENPGLTSLTTPSTMLTGTMSSIFANGTGLMGTLDLSWVTKWSTAGLIHLFNSPNLTSITFPTSITGTIRYLYLYNCDLTGSLDLSVFTTWHTSGSGLRVENNPNLTSITFPASATGTFLYWYFNDLPLVGYISPLSFPSLTNVASSDVRVNNNNWTAAQVNQFLYEINSISVSGYSGRDIYISGSNAAPDSSSGGYDGLAAKASLQAKGFTVTTN